MISIVLAFLCIATATLSIDHCADSLCRGTRTHIACKNTGAFGEACPNDANIIEFTNELKQLVLDTHNSYRNRIACGEVERYGKAARMATLVWHDELAKFAEYNVRQCVFGHDECRNTEKFLHAGQNLGQMQNNQLFIAPENIIKLLSEGWFSEKAHANMSIIQQYLRTNKKIGHFTQMARDQAYAIGCAMVQYIEFGAQKWYTSTFGCNYSLTSILYKPIYDASSKAASECKTGTNPKFKCLCSINEIYNNKLYYND